MKMYHRETLLALSLLAIACIGLISSLAYPAFALAASPGRVKTHVTKGPIIRPINRSHLLHQPKNAPKLVTFKPASQRKSPITSAWTVRKTAACPSPTIDLKVLVIASDGNEVDLPAIKQTLDYLGTPYTVYVAAQTPNGLTPDKLGTGCHGYYEGVILTNGTVSYSPDGTSWVSALSQQEWTNLWGYESTMGVRELSWYTYPTADFGYQSPSAGVNTSVTPIPAKITAQAQPAFPYMNPGTTVTISNAYAYLAQPLTDGATTVALSDANGNALAAVRSYSDGRQALSLTFDSNPYLVHTLVLSYGLVNWLTQGVFLGARHTYMSAQVDDVFIDDDEWLPTTPCGTPTGSTGASYRITGSDLQSVNAWQQRTRKASSVSANTTLSLAFNGFGTTPGSYPPPDTLTPAAVATQGQFNWISHTYDHFNLDNMDYSAATSEIVQNNQLASNLGLKHYSSQNMVTPEYSGLTNPAYLQAAYDHGIRYLVSNTSITGYNNPTPNAGIYNSYQPKILMLPRRPTNLFYNVSTPDEWTAEYNCIYASYWGRNLSYSDILDVESQTLLSYLLKGEMDPWMFHQANLRAYDGVHTLLGDLLDLTLQKYKQYYNLPIVNQTMDNSGKTVASWTQYIGAGVTASITPGVSITITTQKDVSVPVTGLNASGSEMYGGQYISHVSVAAGHSVTLPLT